MVHVWLYHIVSTLKPGLSPLNVNQENFFFISQSLEEIVPLPLLESGLRGWLGVTLEPHAA